MKKNGMEQEPLTMAQIVNNLLNETTGEEGETTREALCRAIMEKAQGGDLKALQWVCKIAGEQERENRRTAFEL